MNLDFLSPVARVIPAHNEILPAQALGRNVLLHTEKGGLPDLEGVQLAIIGVNETRNGSDLPSLGADLTAVRREFYQLYAGNWKLKIADLGDIKPGASSQDTLYALSTLAAELMRKGVIPVVLGGAHDLTYALYRAFDQMDQMVNLVCVDSKFDLGDGQELISSRSYMSRIIMDEPHNLFNYTNLGFQTYFNAQEEIDLMEKLFFDAYRLGAVTSNLAVAEPVMRDADLVSIDMGAVKASEWGGGTHAYPNGFDGREICALARYAGISDKLSAFGIFEIGEHLQSARLVAQMLWYFVEGVSLRRQDYPSVDSTAFTYYTIPLEDFVLRFLKSNLSGRWWVEIPQIENLDNKFKKQTLLPCTQEEYLEACDGQVPERCWKAYKKMLV